MRMRVGDDRTRQWLEGPQGQRLQVLREQPPLCEAVAAGEIDVGLVNHYYLYLIKEEQPDAPVANHFLCERRSRCARQRRGRRRARVRTGNEDDARTFVEYLLSDERPALLRRGGRGRPSTRSSRASTPRAGPAAAGRPHGPDISARPRSETSSTRTLALLSEVGLHDVTAGAAAAGRRSAAPAAAAAAARRGRSPSSASSRFPSSTSSSGLVGGGTQCVAPARRRRTAELVAQTLLLVAVVVARPRCSSACRSPGSSRAPTCPHAASSPSPRRCRSSSRATWPRSRSSARFGPRGLLQQALEGPFGVERLRRSTGSRRRVRPR